MNNIALLIPSLTIGGAEKLTLTIAESLTEHNNVYLILLEEEINLKIINDKVNIIKLSNTSTYAKVNKLLNTPLYIYRLLKCINKYNINKVYSVMERANVINLFTSFFNKSYLPIISVHATPSIAFKEKPLFVQHLIRLFYSKVSDRIKVVTVSNGIKNELSDIYNMKDIKVIYNPINTSQISFLSNENMEDYEFDNAKFNIITVGRLSQEKGHIHLINALSKIDDKYKEKINLVIVGDGKELNSLKDEVNRLSLENVSFLGYQKNPYKYMKNADLFVLSSLYEGFGIVLVEAMSLGVPILSSNCKYGPAEILIDDKDTYGTLVPLSNDYEEFSNDLSKQIISLYKNKEIRKDLKTKGIKRAQAFDINNICKEYINLFK